jgi:glycosyltransferase involved in cell wall biosynthesis
LGLTVNSTVFPKVAELIKSKNKQYGLNIENIDLVTGEDALELYKKAEILIFPSILESFGLPLIEARAAGLRIVASELDYVRDILDPEESFDPHSSASIVRAVKRIMKLESKVDSLISARDFFDLLDVKEGVLGSD